MIVRLEIIIEGVERWIDTKGDNIMMCGSVLFCETLDLREKIKRERERERERKREMW